MMAESKAGGLRQTTTGGFLANAGPVELVLLSALVALVSAIAMRLRVQAPVHEFWHVFVAILYGDWHVRFTWAYTWSTVDNALMCYAGYFGSVVTFAAVAVVAGLRRRPLLAAFGLGSVLPQITGAPASGDWAAALEHVGPYTHDLVTGAFVVVWAVAAILGLIACAYACAAGPLDRMPSKR